MKRIICFALACIMSVSVFGCGKKNKYDFYDDYEVSYYDGGAAFNSNTGLNAKDQSEYVFDEKDIQPQKNNDEADKAAVTQACEKFMTAVCAFDFKEASKYANIDIAEALGFDSLDGYFASIGLSSEDFVESYLGDMDENVKIQLREPIDNFIDAVIDRFCNTIDYEITDVSKEDGKWIVYVSMEMVDFDSMGDFSELIDIDAVTSDLIDEYSSLPQSELEALGEDGLVVALMTDVFEIMTDVYLEAMDSAESTRIDDGLYVEMKDGKWVVVADEFVKAFK